jgi:hypothetical protein
LIRSAPALLLLLSTGALAAPQTIVSTAAKVSLLELYTSEGCDSCPPAEAWLSDLQGDDRLWKRVVPVTFHVDYWDYLGWRDPFDSHAYTQRQQAIAAAAGGKTIYTPQFVMDGKDWLNFFDHRPLTLDGGWTVGVLSLAADGRKVTVHFAPQKARDDRLEAHVVLLAFGVDVPVGAGENHGKTLRHDFLVVSDTHGPLAAKDGSYEAVMTLAPPLAAAKATHYALAGWVSRQGDPEPIQAAGGMLKP